MMTDRTGGPLYTNLEDEMYRVMAALSAGDVPVDFKGAMVLHAFLYSRNRNYENKPFKRKTRKSGIL